MIRFAVAALALFGTLALQAQDAGAPPPAIPIREITVFKDGHALLLHEGEMLVDAAGNVVIDGLPQPVIGSFWPYSAEARAPLSAVVAGHRNVRIERDATSILDLLKANKGAQITITLKTRDVVTGTLLDLQGGLVLLKSVDGLKPLALEAIDTVTFRDRGDTKVSEDQDRTALTLRLDWGAQAPAKTARVGMMYLQKGIRWIPSYRIDIDGQGQATVKLQATLVNELADLDNVSAHLVVGVPSFAFKDTPDPISLQRAVAQLSRAFQPDNQTAYAFGNAIYSQRSRGGEVRNVSDAAPAEAAGLDGDSHEDLHVFSIKKLSLKKGEVMVLPVTEFKVEYKDVYAIEIPMTPPQDVQAQMRGQDPTEVDRLFRSPKAIHKIRLVNKTSQPITTAPALILQGGRLIAQGMTTYTSSGGVSDVELTTAVDIQVKKTDTEKGRLPEALRWYNNTFQQVKLEGRICLTNYRKAPVEVEVSRVVLGEVAEPVKGGSVEKLNLMEDRKGVPGQPNYYYWYSSWWWWNQVNPVSRITWKATLEPGKSTDLDYAWSYYWHH
jgi:hypothetical protein